MAVDLKFEQLQKELKTSQTSHTTQRRRYLI
jgi:hypothetical protein